MPAVISALVVLALLAASCSGDPNPAAERAAAAGTTAASPVPSPATRSPTAPAVVPTTGATGTTGGGPAEPRTRFAGRITPLPEPLRARMRGTTWRPGCPVPLEDLRLLRFNHWGFDGTVKRGPLVVNASVAQDVLWVFRQLFEHRFPMKRVGLAREFKERRLETDPHTRRSVTASFNCRVVVTPAGPGDTYSQHSYGLAVDVNPLQNPYVRSDGWVRNRFARPYVDRTRRAPGMIHEGDVVVRSFASIGWAWGGHWSGGKDYMHFSLLGR